LRGKYGALTARLGYVNLLHMRLIRGLFWLVLFVFFTFSFVVLFEYGPHDFVDGFQKEFVRVRAFVVKQTEKAQRPKK
jgi:hypothetical protein